MHDQQTTMCSTFSFSVFFIFIHILTQNEAVFHQYGMTPQQKGCGRLLQFSIILDSTNTITSADFRKYGRITINEMLMELKGISFTMSARIYHGNADCKQPRDLNETEIFINLSSGREVRDKLLKMNYFSTDETFDMSCAKTLLARLQSTAAGANHKKPNTKSHAADIGIILTKRSSLEDNADGNSNNDFAAGLFTQRQERKTYFSNAKNLAINIFKDLCELIDLPSTTTSMKSTISSSFHTTNLHIATQTFMHSSESTIPSATVMSSRFTSMINSSSNLFLTPQISSSSFCEMTLFTTNRSVQVTSTLSRSIKPTTIMSRSTKTTTTAATQYTTLAPWVIAEKEIDDILSENITSMMLKNKAWTLNYMKNITTVLRKTHFLQEKNVTQKVSRLIDYLEEVLAELGEELPIGQKFSFSDKEISMEVSSVAATNFTGLIFIPKNEPTEIFRLPKSLFAESKQEKSVITLLYIPVPAFMKLSTSSTPFAKLFSVNVKPQIEAPLKNPLMYSMSLLEKNASTHRCVFWNKSLSHSGNWDYSGCHVTSENNSVVTCQCNHMTSFSVLMQTKDVKISVADELALTMITYIGCGVSIAASFGLIMIFATCGRLMKSDRNVIHINLTLAIGIANCLFISADYLHKNKGLCVGISIGMMYCYLSAFFWMLVEGIHVYQMVVKVFSVMKMMNIYLFIGWGCPAIIVAITASIKHKYFTRNNFCWISTEHHVIWAFIGPVLCIILTNVVILARTLCVSYKMTVATSEMEKLQKLAQLTLILMPVFGLSWIFGILAVNQKLILFQYIFALLNAFQGLFIFIGYVLLNSDVKREYDRVKRRSLHSSFKSHGNSDTLRSSTEEMRNRRKSSQFSLISMMSFRIKNSDSMGFRMRNSDSTDFKMRNSDSMDFKVKNSDSMDFRTQHRGSSDSVYHVNTQI